MRAAAVAVLSVAVACHPAPRRAPHPDRATIRVVDDDGAPVDGASVMVIEARHVFRGEVPPTWDIDRVAAPPTSWTGETTVAIPDGEAAYLALASRVDRPVQAGTIDRRGFGVVVLGPARTVAGHVSACPGAKRSVRVALEVPQYGCHDCALHWLRAHLAQPAVPVDDAGDFTLTGIGAGRYTLHVDGCDGAYATVTDHDAQIDVSIPH